MKPWKLVLGAGAACVACCAAPVATAAATLWIAASGLVAGATGLLAASTRSWLPLAIGGLVLAVVAGAVAWHRWRRPQPATTCGGRHGTGGAACAWPRIGP